MRMLVRALLGAMSELRLHRLHALALLKLLMSAIPRAEVHVVRNGYFGDEKKFELYNASRCARRWRVEGASRSRCPTWPIGSPTTST
jgi:hypothetical protein